MDNDFAKISLNFVTRLRLSNENETIELFKFLFWNTKHKLYTRDKSSRNERPHQRRAKHELKRPIHTASECVCISRKSKRQRGDGGSRTSGNGNVEDFWSLRWKLSFV